ncbi:chromosomal replication initiator protein DnaA [Candidatus Dependentiae bacterium]|nr:chromosomal replication initiator protein DnaA [Candidatus Dependentiae bacterium]
MNKVIDQVWQDFLKIIKEEVGIRVVETWIKAVALLRYDSLEQKIYLSAPNLFVKNWVETHYTFLFKKHLKRLLNVDDVFLIFCVGSCDAEVKNNAFDLENHLKVVPAVAVEQKKKQKYGLVKKAIDYQGNFSECSLNPLYTFDSFVVGENNSFAYASARAVVQKLGKLYNPLLLYGSSGLGKTHLLHAIGNEILAQFPEVVILYQTTDKFVNEFIHAIRFDHIAKFQMKYRKIDVLLLDDIQFMVNKEQTQEAFFHIFNALYESNKQIILSSDTLPRNLGGLVDRLKSRLEWGLVADVQLPMLETKIAILKRKADQQKEILPDDVALFIAHQHVKSVRELEGSLIRVLAYASLTNQPIHIELVKKVLGQSQDFSRETVISVSYDFHSIISQIQKHFSYTLDDLRSKDRSKGVSHARQVAMYLMKKYTGKSLREIGEYLDRKDHTTITHAIQRIKELQASDEQFCHQLKLIEQSFVG